MPDEIDRDQEFTEQQPEAQITRVGSILTHYPSLLFFCQCSETILGKRRFLLPGMALCTDCQAGNEQKFHALLI
ncbi:TraR/DksA family transcriptional regulator [Klebsiella pneumoniae]|uniref:TraR/DksA family transcriptional regulator n=1 Tax=Klebsiella pneumoniae TaxID=573 RepID=UPI00203C89C9|nr:TraR/DksA family transcriptional regulator [Klebsiella pneumoniae]USB67209.1 TraR/DksA family transcriptional regulator [Klebsiella pneumoniae]HBT4924917.1 TraR/DksA family transcriptional regulator [Klebsiella pneumoniae]